MGVGRAPLSALREWQHRKSKRHEDEPPPELGEGGSWVLRGAPPGVAGRKFFIGEKSKKRRPVIVYTDAMYDGAKTPAGWWGS